MDAVTKEVGCQFEHPASVWIGVPGVRKEQPGIPVTRLYSIGLCNSSPVPLVSQGAHEVVGNHELVSLAESDECVKQRLRDVGGPCNLDASLTRIEGDKGGAFALSCVALRVVAKAPRDVDVKVGLVTAKLPVSPV